MGIPQRFTDEDYTPRLWAELYPVLRNIKTDDLAKKMVAYKNKPVKSWRADDWRLQYDLREDVPVADVGREILAVRIATVIT